MSLVLNVEILGEYKKLTQATKGATKQLQGIGKTTSKISNLMSGALGAIGVGFSLNAVVNGIKDVVNASSDLNEATNAINVAFGKSAKEIEKFGKDAAQAVGLSKTELYGIATQFSSFAKTVAGEGGNAAKVVQDIATRGADFASVFNLDVSDALSKFQSGLAGQSEPLRAFGIDLSAASVEAFAVANGIIKQGETMTETEKVMARYGLLMEQTAMTQGDFQNTSDGLANTQRILKAEFENVKAEVGTALLPVMTELFMTIRDNLPAIKELISDLIKFIPPMIEAGIQVFKFREQLIPTITAIGAVTTGLKLASVAVGLFSASSAPMVAAVAGLAAIAAAMVTVYNNTKQATSAMEEFQRLQGIERATSNPIAAPEQIAAATNRGILGDNPALNPPKTTGSSGLGIAGQSSKNTAIKIPQPKSPSPSSPIVINNNVTVKKSTATAPDIVKALNTNTRNLGFQAVKNLK